MATRNAHRRRDAAGHVDSFFQRRKRFESVLAPMGLWEKFVAMPRPMQDMFCKLKLPDPLVVFDESAKQATKLAPKGLRAAADRYLQSATVKMDDGREIAVRDFIGVVMGTLEFCRFVNAGLIPQTKTAPPAFKAFVEAATPVLEQCHTANAPEVGNRIYGTVMNALVYGTGLDKQLFTARLDTEMNERGRQTTRIVVSATPAQQCHVELDGLPRPMSRTGQIGQNTLDVKWVSWDAGLLPGGLPGRSVPVYVQSHALRRLHERVKLPYADPWLEPWLATSLAEPVIVERSGDDWLVEYRVKTYRLGYLVVSSAQEQHTRERCLAVRTFKLLTMAGMPEAQKLERKLKLSRPDVNWLRLHELESFTHTDLRGDPLLRRLMEECGCGHLFELAEQVDFAAPEPKALAGEVRKYLRLAA